ncbi:MAG TPA: MEDS domain-containing protein [Streptosporangiaceae bacterium]|nr:MEDS domain-containing protein [Streptosporangiaceae bacterium]
MATGTEVLDLGRGDHVVVFYQDEQELVGQVSDYLLPAAQEGGVAIVVATPGHHRAFEERLAGTGADVAAARRRGSYLTLDAGETMRGFMVADWPDPAGFWQAISPRLRHAATAGKPVRVFGEMVALLWDAGLVSAAIEVEAMWNELGGQYPFSLLCAYPAQQVSCAHHLDALTEVCRAHTHVIGGPPESAEAQPHGM